MITSTSRVVLREVYGTSGLATRESASIIAKTVEGLDAPQVELDFSGIDHASLAFLDQLLHDTRQTGKTISLVNVGEFVRNLLQVLEKRRQSGQYR